MSKALIIGITGQDGSYLAELLLSKGYEVHGIVRRASSINTKRIDHIYSKLHLHYGDLSDSTSINNIVRTEKPDEIYNLGAQSHVKVSFEVPEYTADIDAVGQLRILESCHALMQIDKSYSPKIYFAGTSELYGGIYKFAADENTPFCPRSPYAVAKQYGVWITREYRTAYGMFCCNGILFNHEGPRRGETFVTKKITKAVANIHLGKQDKVVLGNLDAFRDWGDAEDYVEAMWLMLQQENPDDYVIATGETHSVREFAELAFDCIGMMLQWHGTKDSEFATDQNGVVRVEVSPKYYRPSEVEYLLGDSTKARKTLNWKPKTDFKHLVKKMVDYDLGQ